VGRPGPALTRHGAEQSPDITGTLQLLEVAVAARVKSFIYISTTSVFGSALSSDGGDAAVWVTEELSPRPKNIYGVTKLTAETLCELTHRAHGLPILILRTSRFFPEEDDNPAIRRDYATTNAQANEMLYRRIDIEDAVSAALLALEKAPALGFGRYIISATTPFSATDGRILGQDAPGVVRRLFPECEPLFAAQGWKLFPRIDRVYVNQRARDELGWSPHYDFQHVLDCLAQGSDFRSTLAREVGSKGYHDKEFREGPYPVS
jgi:UDP-glucose 4-epimerase